MHLLFLRGPDFPAGALLLPKDFVSLGNKFHYDKDTFSYNPNQTVLFLKNW